MEIACAMGNLVVIPARLGSERLPNKPLLDLHGEPLVVHTVRQASQSARADRVIVATDSTRIVGVVEQAGFEAVMTEGNHLTGTDRVAEVARRSDAKRVVNVQGDEPLIDPGLIDGLFDLLASSEAPMVTAVHRTDNAEGRDNPAIVKVARDREGRALYFSRSPLPHHRDQGNVGYWRHVGIYGYQRGYLLAYSALPVGELEQAEKLEQLRALENGDAIFCLETSYEGCSVDTPDDYQAIREKSQ